MTDNPTALSQTAISLVQLFSFLGAPKEVVQLNSDDVLRRHPQADFGRLSQTFTVAELLDTLARCIPYYGKLERRALLFEGVHVNISLENQRFRGRFKLELEFYPGKLGTIEILSPENPESQLETLGFIEFLSKFSDASYFSTNFLPHLQSFPVDVLRPGSSGWQEGSIRLNLKFYPDSSEVEAEQMQSPLDEIRKLMAENT